MDQAGKVNGALCTVFASPIGKLALYTDQNNLLRIDLVDKSIPTTPAESPIAKQVVQVLTDYFLTGKLAAVPIAPKGTEFQQSVWQALTKIPTGKTLTYGELAQQLGSSARAIGAACRSNPILIIIPCHRVTAQNSLGGYMGSTQGEGLKNKTYLLQKEGAI